LFVSFEGVDRSGKSTQVERLAAALREDGREVVVAREPGGTELGELVRELVLKGPEMTPLAEAILFAASRAELVAEVIAPALERGAFVVCDRFVDSSLAYQGIARGLGVDDVLQLNLRATGGLLPDRTFLFAVDPAQAAARSSGLADRIEREGLAFQARVDEAFRQVAAMFPERIVLLDGTQPAAELARMVRDELRQLS
jgi:dTMP kinase